MLQAIQPCGLTHCSGGRQLANWTGSSPDRVLCASMPAMPIGRAVPEARQQPCSRKVRKLRAESGFDGDRVSLIKRFSRRKPVQTGVSPSNEKL